MKIKKQDYNHLEACNDKLEEAFLLMSTEADIFDCIELEISDFVDENIHLLTHE